MKHLINNEIKSIVLEKMKISSRLMIPLGSLQDMEIHEFVDHTSDCFVTQLNVYLASKNEKKVEKRIVKVHADWFQMFKESYFPRWLLKLFPVQMIELKFNETTTITKICPHIPMGKEHYQCIQWIAESE